MKNYILGKLSSMFFAVFSLCALSVTFAFAQTDVTDNALPIILNPESSLADLIEWTDLLYTSIIIISGYLSAYIPGIRNIPSTAWRVAAIALVVAVIFILMGSKGFGLLFGYLAATGFYDLILSFIKKTPQPAQKKTSFEQRPPVSHGVPGGKGF